MASLSSIYAANRTTVIGAGAAVVIAVAAVLGLRNRTPAVVVAPAATTAATDSSGVDLGAINAAYGAGASAASSGLGVGSELGTQALGLAGSVVSSQAGVAQTLADSQANVAGTSITDFAATMAALIANQAAQAAYAPQTTYVPPTPLPLPTTPDPVPVAPTPAPAPAPAPTGHRILFASGTRTIRIYHVTSRGCYDSWTDHTGTGAASSASCGAAYQITKCTGGSLITVVQVTSGTYAGQIAGVSPGLGSGISYQ